MKIIITGASGFVGQNLSEFLESEKAEVQALSLRQTDWKQNIDKQAKAIIHLAGKAHDTENTSEETEYFKVNRDLTIEVFKEFLASDIQDFFFFSSVKAAVDTIDEVLTEDISPVALTPYGKSKLEAEEYLLAQELPKDKRLFIIRPAMIHGPGNKGNLNLLYKVVEKGVPWPLAAYHNQRSFIGIDNLNYLIHQMLIKELPSGIYNFADDEPVSTNDLIRVIATSIGKKPRLWKLPKGLINSLARIGDFLPSPLNSERLKKLTENYVVSNSKIKQALGIKNLPLSAEKALEETIKSFKNNPL